MVKLSEILHGTGVFSKDFKTRIAQKQIIVNGDAIEGDIEIDIDFIHTDFFMDIGDLMFILMRDKIWQLQLQIFGIENLVMSNISNSLTEELRKFLIVRTSKKNVFVIKLNE